MGWTNRLSHAEAPQAEFEVAPDQGRCHLRFLVALACLASFRLWFLPLASSFWLDELVTFWSAYKGVIPAIARSQFWPGQNLLYTVLAAAVIRIGGTSEVALRLPSVLATLLTAWLLFRLGEHFLDREAGILAMVAFTSLHEVARDAATNARPYGIALLLVVASVLQLVRFLDSRRWRNMFGFVVMTAAIPYFHYLFVTMYGVFFAYAIYAWRTDHRIRTRDLVVMSVLVAILLSPLVWSLVHTHALSSESSFSATPDVQGFISAFMPQILAATLFLGALAGGFASPKAEGIVAALPRSARFLFAAWLAIPILATFIMARVSPLKIFVPRYYLPAYAALALIVGCGIRVLAPSRRRVIIASFVVVGSIVSYSGYHVTSPPHREDWRAAAALVRAAAITPTTPVLVRVGLVETAKIHWSFDIDRDSPLLCPISKYPMPGRLILLPSHLNPDAVHYLEKITSQVLKAPQDRFVLVARNEGEFIPWLRGWFLGQGFDSSELGDSEGVPVYLFRRFSHEEKSQTQPFPAPITVGQNPRPND